MLSPYRNLNTQVICPYQICSDAGTCTLFLPMPYDYQPPFLPNGIKKYRNPLPLQTLSRRNILDCVFPIQMSLQHWPLLLQILARDSRYSICILRRTWVVDRIRRMSRMVMVDLFKRLANRLEPARLYTRCFARTDDQAGFEEMRLRDEVLLDRERWRGD